MSLANITAINQSECVCHLIKQNKPIASRIKQCSFNIRVKWTVFNYCFNAISNATNFFCQVLASKGFPDWYHLSCCNPYCVWCSAIPSATTCKDKATVSLVGSCGCYRFCSAYCSCSGIYSCFSLGIRNALGRYVTPISIGW